MTENPVNRIATGYGRFYAPIAVCLFAFLFFPLYDTVVVREEGVEFTSTYGTVFDMATNSGGAPAMIGILLLAALLAMLAVAAVRGAVPPLLVTMAVVSTLMAVLVLTKVGTGTPAPPITDAGKAGVALLIATAVLTAVHAVHFSALRRRNTAAPDSEPR
ncbi:hypothetical protein [Amycolatopsis sp. CA-230715]|uniref:hypothetical protein n=1 Tax=Amycolatopsis sp. CA-230715 TaxID=2745196 RepID=UPI001C021EE0|nr:hypothetical protein [Amycolatopsis sp. CA-230715]